MRALKFARDGNYFRLRRASYEHAERLANIMVLLGATHAGRTVTVAELAEACKGRGVAISKDRIYRITKTFPGFAPVHQDLTLTYYFEQDLMAQFAGEGLFYPKDLYLLQRLAPAKENDWVEKIKERLPNIEAADLRFVSSKAPEAWTEDECLDLAAFAIHTMTKTVTTTKTKDAT